MDKNMDRVLSIGKMEIFTKVIGKKVKSMERDALLMKMEIKLRECLKKEIKFDKCLLNSL